MSDVDGANEALYTMRDAARAKGVSYHTVSRAVRKGLLEHMRLGRQALIPASALGAWRPMVQRRPKRYEGRAPDPDVRPRVMRAGKVSGLMTGRAMARLVPVLVSLGEREAPAETPGAWPVRQASGEAMDDR